MEENNRIINLLINYKKLEAKPHKIGVTVKKDFMVFYSNRANDFPYKKGCLFSLTISRKTNTIKAFDFQNYQEIDNFETLETFINYLTNML